jgi:predicted transcriptional regulator
MKKIVDYLQNLGLSEVEAKLYQEIVKTGPTTVKEVAELLGINRVTAHFQIDNLIEKGLVSQLKQTARRQVLAEPPERLHYLIEQKEKMAKYLRTNFSDLIKTINSILPKQNIHKQKVEVKYFERKKAVRQIYDDVLSSNEIRSYVKLDAVSLLFPKNVELFVKAMKKNSKLVLWEIVERSEISKKNTRIFAKNNRYHYKIAHPLIKFSSSDVMIYNNKIAIINLAENVSGLIIKSPDFYKLSKEIFDFVWKMTPD